MYAAFSRFFVVIAPPVTAEGVTYNHYTYAKRGWCRLEQWARIAQCGVENMYVCHGDGVGDPLVSSLIVTVSATHGYSLDHITEPTRQQSTWQPVTIGMQLATLCIPGELQRQRASAQRGGRRDGW